MDSGVMSANGDLIQESPCEVPYAGLASAVAFAAAGSLLGYSLFAKKRRLPVAGQVFLGAVAGCAGAVIWTRREQEWAAARELVEHVNDARDRHWLKRHPVAYG